MQGAAWDSMFLTVVRIATILSSLVLTKILSVGLSLESYGTYAQANTVISIGTSVILLGLGDAINYFYNNASNDIEDSVRIRIVNTIFALEILAGLFLAVVIVLGSDWIVSYFFNDALKVLLTVVALKPLLDNLNYFYQLLYVSTGKAKVIAVRNLVISALKLGITYVTVYILKDILCVFVALILLDALQLLFFKVHFRSVAFLISPIRMSWTYISGILAYSIPMGIYVMTSTLSREMDKLVIGRLTNTETLAIYANCSKILPFDIISVSFATVLIPYIMRYVSGNRQEDATKLFRNYLKVGYYSVWTFGVAVLISAGQVIAMLYSQAYLQGKTVFIIYVIDSMLKFASIHLILTAGGKAKTVMVYSMATLGLNFVLNILFFYGFGMNGPAVATLATTALYTYMVLRKSVGLIRAKWNEVFDIKDLVTFAISIFLMGTAFRGINRWLCNLEIHQFIAMLVSSGGFCFSILLINRKRIITTLQQVNSLRA